MLCSWALSSVVRNHRSISFSKKRYCSSIVHHKLRKSECFLYRECKRNSCALHLIQWQQVFWVTHCSMFLVFRVPGWCLLIRAQVCITPQNSSTAVGGQWQGKCLWCKAAVITVENWCSVTLKWSKVVVTKRKDLFKTSCFPLKLLFFLFTM